VFFGICTFYFYCRTDGCCHGPEHECPRKSIHGNSAADSSRHGHPDHRTDSGADLSIGANPEHNG
jgi:hypothetical protein